MNSIQQFIDQDKINKALGEKSGFTGLIFATLAGVITLAGLTSFHSFCSLGYRSRYWSLSSIYCSMVSDRHL